MEIPTHGIPKIINKIFKRGHIPSRSIETYRPSTARMVNCFGHACFNLDEKDLLSNFTPSEMRYYLRTFLGRFWSRNLEGVEKEFQDKIKETGLKVEKSNFNEKLKDNQWKVAFYFRDSVINEEYVGSDPHFMLQTKSGFWTSKMGGDEKIEIFKELPKEFGYGYVLQGIYKITNPYLEKEADEENE